MNQAPDNNLEMLKSLSNSLASGVSNAGLEAKRANEQFEALRYSKGLVDETLKILGDGKGSIYCETAQFTIFPTGSMVIPMCEQYEASALGSDKSFYANQIQSTIQAGVSALIADSSPETLMGLESLRQMLFTHNEKLLSLEDRLSSRLKPYAEYLETILRGALTSYRDAGNPLRFSNTGNALRELLREFLDVVAPDTDVKKAPWFIPDKTSNNGVTRRHRIDYAIFNNLTKDKFPKTFSEQTDEIATKLLKHIGTLSALTHVTEKVLGKSYLDAAPLFADVMQHFLLLVSAIEARRALIEEKIVIDILSHFHNIFTSDFFADLDCLSTHTYPQGASNVEIDDLTFDEKWVEFSGHGSVECELQYGSDGDVRNGDGLEWSDSFPFTFSGKAPIDDLTRIEIDTESISIDTSSYDDDSD